MSLVTTNMAIAMNMNAVMKMNRMIFMRAIGESGPCVTSCDCPDVDPTTNIYLTSIYKPIEKNVPWETDGCFRYNTKLRDKVRECDALDNKGLLRDSPLCAKVRNFRLSYQCILQLAGISDDMMRDVVKIVSGHACTLEELSEYVNTYITDEIVSKYSVLTAIEEKLRRQRE